MARILFVYQKMLSFVQHDREILEREHELVDFEFPLQPPSRRKSATWILSHARRLKRAMRDVDGTFIWFGDIPTAFAVRSARRLGKRSIVVAGGYGAAYIHGTDYGLQNRQFRRPFAKYSFEKADLVVTVSKRMRKDLHRFARPRKEVMIYNGIRTELYSPGNKHRKVLSVAEMTPITRWKKGIETYVRAAEHLPDVPFIMVGSSVEGTEEELKSIASDNVEFRGFIPFEELLALFQTSKVYVQVSAYESFGYAPAESMLCEGVPVVTRRGALPEVVGDTGYYVPYDDPVKTAKAVELALDSDLGTCARERVLERFSLERRQELLLEAVGKVLS